MSVKVAINGFGRIGRLAFRQMFGAEGFEVVAINDLTSPAMLAHLLKYDSTQGAYAKPFGAHTVEAGEDHIIVDGKKITIYAKANAAELPWGEIGVAVALSSALCYDSKTVVLSLLGTYFGGMIVDHFIFGINIKRRVCVISKDLDNIVDYVLHTLHSGATLNEIIGAYDKKPKMEMVTIVDKHEYKQLMDYIRKVDPKAFVTVYSVSDMRYQPKIK